MESAIEAHAIELRLEIVRIDVRLDLLKTNNIRLLETDFSENERGVKEDIQKADI